MHLLCLSIPYMCGLHVNPTDYIILYINIFVYIYSIFSDVQPYIHTWTPAQASAYTCVRARIGGAAAHNGRAATKTGRARPPRWRAAESGAYRFQCGDARGVPRADVCVERRRIGERLRAEPHEVHAGGKDSYVSARIRAPPNAHAQQIHHLANLLQKDSINRNSASQF